MGGQGTFSEMGDGQGTVSVLTNDASPSEGQNRLHTAETAGVPLTWSPHALRLPPHASHHSADPIRLCVPASQPSAVEPAATIDIARGDPLSHRRDGRILRYGAGK